MSSSPIFELQLIDGFAFITNYNCQSLIKLEKELFICNIF